MPYRYGWAFQKVTSCEKREEKKLRKCWEQYEEKME